MEVVEAKFPEDQKLAKSSDLVVTVRNAGKETIPNIAVTVNGLDRRVKDPDLADPTRPVFALNGVQVEIAGFPEAKDAAPRGLRHRLREHLGVRPAQRGPGEDVPLVGHGGAGRRFQGALASGSRPGRQGKGGGGGWRPRTERLVLGHGVQRGARCARRGRRQDHRQRDR